MPVSREVFRPRPNVESALVAFRRVRPGLDPGVKRVVEAAFAPPPKDARELARARGRRVPRARRGGARGDRPRPGASAPSSSRRAEFVAPRSRARMIERAGAREDQPRARRSARRARTACTRSRRSCSGVELADTVSLEPAAELAVEGFAGRHARPRARSRHRRAAPASSRAGARGSRSGSRSRPASAAAAPTPRRRSRSPTRCSTSRRRAELLLELARSLGADVPFFLEPGPQLGARRRHRARAGRPAAGLHGAAAPPARRAQAVDGRDLRPLPTARRASTSGARAWSRSARAGARADLASLPPNDLARSPLAAGCAGSARSGPTSAAPGPTVYGALRRPRRRRGRADGASPRRSARPGSRHPRGSVCPAMSSGATVLDQPDTKPSAPRCEPAEDHALDRRDRGRPGPSRR